MGTEIQFYRMTRAPEVDGGDGYPSVWMHLLTVHLKTG